jgi:hypothetical protein
VRVQQLLLLLGLVEVSRAFGVKTLLTGIVKGKMMSRALLLLAASG